MNSPQPTSLPNQVSFLLTPQSLYRNLKLRQKLIVRRRAANGMLSTVCTPVCKTPLIILIEHQNLKVGV